MNGETQTSPPPNDAEKLAKAQAIYETLLASQQSAMLATINADSSPLASYTPFAVDAEKRFYVFISLLSYHTGNLLRSQQASLMVIEDEAETKQIFARSRLTFGCRATELARDGQEWETAAALYEARFGGFFKLIRGLGDFKMFQLVPQTGTLTVGFGQAYTLAGAGFDQLTLRTG